MNTVSRRDFFAMIMAGGVVTATGIWMPGERLISIPARIGTNFQELFMQEFLKQQRVLTDLMAYGRSAVRVLNTPDRPWFSLERVDG